MPPTPSSASKEKKTSGTKKVKSSPEDLEREREEVEKLSNEFMATSLGQIIQGSEEYHAMVNKRPPTHPDVPPCNGCSNPFSGTMQCSRCESVFYCSRECQVSHWSAAHKAECKLLKERNEETAKHVLENFKDVGLWRALDIAGPYKAAVHGGLHDKIREALELDKATLVDRCRNGRVILFSYAQCVMSILFRGQRAEGQEQSRFFNCVDGIRIRGYVRSHENALSAWLQASVELLRAVTDPATLRYSEFHHDLHRAVLDVWSGWTMVFASSTASRAILSLGHGTGDGSAEQRRKRDEDHARGIVRTLVEAHRVVISELLNIAASFVDLPLASLQTIMQAESIITVIVAMVLLRIQEYGYEMDADIESILNLNGVRGNIVQRVGLPMAKRMIEKGRKLTPEEMNAIMAGSTSGMGLR